ncbi:MAG: pseudouridine synthase [Cyanobacteria bacterium P01_A01_bin.3]
MAEAQRLQKVLARWGVASRRQSEAIIRAGRVSVNGEVISALGTKVDPASDRITVDGRPLAQFSASAGNFSVEQVSISSGEGRSNSPPQLRYLLLNKPGGVISTCTDPHGRKTVLDVLPSQWRTRTRWFPVGRLDAASTGALLLTNDGDLTLKLTHPRYHLPKTYRVVVEGYPSASVLQQWRNGIELNDGRTLPADVTLISSSSGRGRSSRSRMAGDRTTLRIVLHEGRNRQIRRVAECLGHPVLALHREAIGPILLTKLAPGACRPLRASEVRRLKAAAGI